MVCFTNFPMKCLRSKRRSSPCIFQVVASVHVLLKSIVQDNECIQVMRGALNCICVHVLLKSIVQDNECIQVMRGALNDSNKRLPKDY